jgi:hypothetical protein
MYRELIDIGYFRSTILIVFVYDVNDVSVISIDCVKDLVLFMSYLTRFSVARLYSAEW